MFQWKEEYLTGNEQVDKEHQEIFRLVGKLLQSTGDETDDDINESIRFLAHYTICHFENEEKLMMESEYPHKDLHKQQHDDFIVQVSALIERVGQEKNRNKNLQDIKMVVVEWLVEHVLGSDKMMATCYRRWQLDQCGGKLPV